MNLDLMAAAVGTGLSFVVGTFVSLFFIYKNKDKFAPFKELNFKLSTFKGLLGQNLNIFGRTAFLTISFFILTKCATSLGTDTLAAHQIALQLWLLASFVIDGFAITGTSLGAKQIGADQFQEFRNLGRKLSKLALLMGICFTICYYFAKGPILSLFTHDPKVLLHIDSIFWLVILFQPLNALVYIFDGLMFATRQYSYMKKHMAIGFLCIFVPILGLFWFDPQFIWLWISLVALNSYRVVSNYLVLKNYHLKIEHHS